MSRFDRIDGKLSLRGSGKILPPGPWHDEPDRVEFEHAGFSCLLLRNASWCGYVAVPPGHPWHGLDYGDVFTLNDDGTTDYPEVHGGLTYSDKCSGLICHVAKPGEPDDVWWLGFDCAHYGDLTLYDLHFGPGIGGTGTYRNVDFVRGETVRLAEQAASLWNGGAK